MAGTGGLGAIGEDPVEAYEAFLNPDGPYGFSQEEAWVFSGLDASMSLSQAASLGSWEQQFTPGQTVGVPTNDPNTVTVTTQGGGWHWTWVSCTDTGGTSGGGGPEVNGGFDFYSLNVNGSIENPYSLTLFGVTLTLTLDRYGKVYLGVGGNVGKSATLLSGSITEGLLDMCGRPTPEELQNFMTGGNWNFAFGIAGGVQEGWSPNRGLATQWGIVTPQIGISWTYSWQIWDFHASW